MAKSTSEKEHALMIVDVQEAFDIPPAVADRIRKYSRRFKRRVFTQFVNPPGSLFRKKLKQHSCEPGSDDLRLLIQPLPGDMVIQKAGYGIREKDIRRLKAAGIKRVTVCGIDTDACVMGVMFSLFDHGIVPRVKENLCWSSTGLQREALKILREQFPTPK
jgi:nicotinamidase-related amidase